MATPAPLARVGREPQGSMLRKPVREIADPESRLAIRELIANAEDALKGSEVEVRVPPQIDHFADGMYAREITMPAGMVITSKIHKTTHFAFVLKGSAEVIDELTGGSVVKAPCMIKTPKGTKRILRIIEDCTWVTVHATEETDVNKIEDEIISQTHMELLGCST